MGVGNLQWNNVQAPDFATAMQGLALAGNSFDRGLTDGQSLATTAQSQLGTNADRQLQLNMMKYQNPDDLAAANASGAVMNGVDARFMTPDQLAQPSGRVTTLLNQQTTNIGNQDAQSLLGLNKFRRGVEQTDTQHEIDARPHVAALMQIYNDPTLTPEDQATRANQYYNDHKDVLSVLPYADQLQNRKGLQEISQGNIRTDTDAISRDQSRWNYQTGAQDRIDQTSAMSMFDDIRANAGGTDPSDFYRYATQNRDAFVQKYGQRAYSKAMENINNTNWIRGDYYTVGGGAPQDANGAAPGGGGGGPSSYQGVSADQAWAGMTGNGAPGGQEGGINKDGSFNVSPKGAIGPAQLMPGTAPEAMRLAGFSPNDQRWKTDKDINLKAGRAYYNSLVEHYGGDVAKATAAYNTGTGHVDEAIRAAGPNGDWQAKLPYQETKDYLTGVLGRVGRTAGTVQAVSTTKNTDAATQIQRIVSKHEGDDSGADVVAQNLTQKGEAFSGADPLQLKNEILRYHNKYPQLKFSVIGDIMAANPGAAKGALGKLGNWFYGSNGLPSYSNDSAVTNALAIAANPKEMARAGAKNAVLDTAGAQVAGSAQMAANAQANAMRRGRTSGLLGVKYNPQMDNGMIGATGNMADASAGVASDAVANSNVNPNGGDVQTPPPAPRVSAALTRASAPAPNQTVTINGPGGPRRIQAAVATSSGAMNSNNDHSGHQFGPLKIFVPAGQFHDQESMDNYVHTKEQHVRSIFAPAEQMSLQAQSIMRMGGAIGSAQRAAFQAQYKMTPEQAVQAGAQRMNQARALLRSFQ